ncbi:N-glycosylase/DNA lyase OGG1-like [Castanea sativa]|uniref:N-glycosylase/DNA lyase OGG1-like n=1 Tax=Castanea sativa TaxID=21020 RepID=UPI003F64CAAF
MFDEPSSYLDVKQRLKAAQVVCSLLRPNRFVSDVMKPLLIEQLMDQEVVTLSGGELQRVVLCLALGRAKYIIGTVSALQSKPGGGEKWLTSLRNMDLQEVIDALSTLPGVGPKVVACIALFSLDQHHAIPVDTHVWQIATRDLLPELAGVRLTPKLCSCVSEAFESKYGKYAGWAQTLLFIAELPSQKALLPAHFWSTKEKKSTKTKNG